MAGEEFKLLLALGQLDVMTDGIVEKWPKSLRHTFAADVRASLAKVVRLVIYASKTELEEKRHRYRPDKALGYYRSCDVELEYFRYLHRKALASKLITDDRYVEWMQTTAECGAMLGGILKRVQRDVDSAMQRRTAKQGSLNLG